MYFRVIFLLFFAKNAPKAIVRQKTNLTDISVCNIIKIVEAQLYSSCAIMCVGTNFRKALAGSLPELCDRGDRFWGESSEVYSGLLSSQADILSLGVRLFSLLPSFTNSPFFQSTHYLRHHIDHTN